MQITLFCGFNFLLAQQNTFTIITEQTDIHFYECDEYDFIHLNGSINALEPIGNPELPIKKLKIALPQNAQVEKIEIIELKKTLLYGEYNIAPCRMPMVAKAVTKDNFSYEKNDSIYSVDSYYPQSVLYRSDEVLSKEMKIVTLDFFPLQYNPVKKKIQLIEKLSFQLTYTNSNFKVATQQEMKKMSKYANQQYMKSLQRNLLNPQDAIRNLQIKTSQKSLIGHSTLVDNSETVIDYVIITADSLVSEFQELATWKLKTGTHTQVVSKEWILGQFYGSDEQESIRSFIQYAYQNWGTYWILLGGDSDIIPERMGWSGYEHKDVKTTTGNNIPTDMYYACLEGNWNADGDMTYGEADYDKLMDGSYVHVSSSANIDQVDREYNVLLGRLPIKSKQELKNYKQKYFNYIKGKNCNPNRALVFSRNSSAIESSQMDFVANAFEDNPNVFIQKYYECVGNHTTHCGTKADVLSALNKSDIAQQYHIVCGYGHGKIQSFDAASDEGITLSEIISLQNSNATGQILYNNHCQTAAFDYDCIGESYIIGKNGGIVY